MSPPFIKTHPRDEKGILPGNDVTFIVELAEKESGVHFEWRKWNDTLPSGCSGAHSEMLTIHQVSPDDTGYYYCCVSNAHGRATSQRAKLSICKSVNIVLIHVWLWMDPGCVIKLIVLIQIPI